MFNTARLEIYIYIFGINNNQTFISQILTFLNKLGESSDFFIPLGYEAKSDFDNEA